MKFDRETKKKQERPVCRCKQCAACLDEARWERIFREKFADPFYYAAQRRTGSPLADL